MITEPVNDTAFLKLVHTQARADSRHPVFVDFARAFKSPEEIAAFLRTRPYRPDRGDPEDGPRIGERPSQRLRRLPWELNCVEGTGAYLSLAEGLDPDTRRSSATVRLRAGYHTFPVERGRPVILDPISPRNALDAGLYHCTADKRQLRKPVRWALGIARHARCSPCEQVRVRNGIDQLTDSVVNRRPIARFDQLATALALAESEAMLWGPDGQHAYAMAEREIRDYLQLVDLAR